MLHAHLEENVEKNYFLTIERNHHFFFIMRKTKIICTIGPASDNDETLIAMAKAGMNVARCNFSHGNHEQHKVRMDMIKRVREKLNLPIAIMLDTKGPEYRIGMFEHDEVFLNEIYSHSSFIS